MADDQLTVVRADGATETLRSVQLASGGHAQVILVSDGPESVPALAGATLVYSVTAAASIALTPPTAGARTCWIRVWHPTQDSTKRLFYRREGTNPTPDGANAESYLLHGEGRMVRLADFTKFKMIAETGQTFTVVAEWSNT